MSFYKCFWCGSDKEKEMATEIFCTAFPERRREFCSWPCAVAFINTTEDDRKKFAIQTIHECGCRIFANG